MHVREAKKEKKPYFNQKENDSPRKKAPLAAKAFQKKRTKKEKTRTFPFGFVRVFNAKIWIFAKNSLQNVIFQPLP